MRHTVDKVNQEAGDDVFDAIHTLMHLYRSRQFRVLRDTAHELTHLEAKVLGYFARHPGAMAGDLAAHSGRDKAQLARLMAGLKARGLIEATVDETDRRRQANQLTAAGLAVHHTIQREVRHVAKRSLEGLSDSERAQLLALLQRVRANLEEGEG